MTLFKSTLWYSIGNLFSRFLGFILLPFYSQIIPVDDFARYALIMSGYAILAALYQGGLHSGFSKYYLEAENEHKKRKIFSSVFNLILVFSLPATVIITLLSNDFSKLILSSPKYGNLISIAVWMLFFDTLFFTALHLLKTQEVHRRVIIISSFSAIMNLVLNLYLVFYLKLNIQGILLAQLLSGMVAFFILLPDIKKNISSGFDFNILKNILTFSFPLLIAGIFSTLVDVVDRFILDSMLDKTAVGVYSFSYRIALIMNVFVISFRTAWTPLSIRLYKQNENYNSLFGESFSKLTAYSLLIILTVSLLIDDLFKFNMWGITLFHSDYLSGISIIPFILLGYAFSGLISFYSVYPYVSGKSSHFLITDVIALVLNVVLNILLIPIWGISGAAVATTFSFAGGMIYLAFIAKGINIEYEKKNLLVLLISAIVLFTVGYSVKILLMDIIIVLVFVLLLKNILKVKLITIIMKEKIKI